MALLLGAELGGACCPNAAYVTDPELFLGIGLTLRQMGDANQYC